MFFCASKVEIVNSLNLIIIICAAKLNSKTLNFRNMVYLRVTYFSYN
jgi:hypothetical protein